MEYEHTIRALKDKKAELIAELEVHQAAVRKITSDIDSLDATLQVFGAGVPKDKAIFPQYRREVAWIVLNALRESTRPLTSEELAKIVLVERKVSPNDRKLVQAVSKRGGGGGSSTTAVKACYLPRKTTRACWSGLRLAKMPAGQRSTSLAFSSLSEGQIRHRNWHNSLSGADTKAFGSAEISRLPTAASFA